VFLRSSPIFCLDTSNAIEFTLVSGDHDQLMGQGGCGDQDVVGTDRLAFDFEGGADLGGLFGFGLGEGEDGDGGEEFGDRGFDFLGALGIEDEAVAQFHDSDAGDGDFCGWDFFELGLGAWFFFDEVADDAGVEEVSH
jgi:hypothetical protein